MFLPLFMAIFLGLVSPSDSNYANYNSDDIVYVTADSGNDDNPTDETPDETPDTGGEIGNTPPR